MSTADENPKEGRWNNEAHTALCTALAEALIASGSSPASKKDLIMAVMKAVRVSPSIPTRVRILTNHHSSKVWF